MGEECPWCMGYGTQFWEQVVFYKGHSRREMGSQKSACACQASYQFVPSSSISAKVSKMSRHECKGYKWQCSTTQSPTQQHNEPQRKILG